ncbi:hypothetical protein BJ546DRAFT_526648 [Cryomyces antarcticus]
MPQELTKLRPASCYHKTDPNQTDQLPTPVPRACLASSTVRCSGSRSWRGRGGCARHVRREKGVFGGVSGPGRGQSEAEGINGVRETKASVCVYGGPQEGLGCVHVCFSRRYEPLPLEHDDRRCLDLNAYNMVRCAIHERKRGRIEIVACTLCARKLHGNVKTSDCTIAQSPGRLRVFHNISLPAF